MSKVLSMTSNFTNLSILRDALVQRGFQPVCQEGFPMIQMDGYSGQKFESQLGIRKDNFMNVTGSHTYGDLGWSQNADGSLGLTGDDILIQGRQWQEKILGGITAAYAEIEHTRTMLSEGFVLADRVTQTDGTVELVFEPAGL